MTTFWCELAWLGGERPEAGVVIEERDGLISSVIAGGSSAPPPAGAERLDGLVIPGFANAHSHAFQRALRGRTHGGSGTFWTWREQMYALAARLDPDSVLILTRAAFAEMALAGITLVGEFHYLHHGPDGVPYDDPNQLGHAVIGAADEVGIRLTLIDACYLHGGIEEPPMEQHRRFCDRDAEAWAARVDSLSDGPMHRVGAAIHSVRAVDPESASVVASWASERGAPLHAHVSEQPAENEACVAAYGGTPTHVLSEAGALSSRFTAVHATHVTDSDAALLGDAGACCCLCPTTERDLADGIAPARQLVDAGARIALGSDSNAVIEPLEEARAVELDERLESGVRGHHRASELLTAATANGYECLGWPGGGVIQPGAPADLVAVRREGVRLAGVPGPDAIGALVFAGAAADVRHVLVGGDYVVRNGEHMWIDVAAELEAALTR